MAEIRGVLAKSRRVDLLTAALLALALASTLTTSARATCGVSETGIPEEAAYGVDVGGARQALANSGVAVGGTYYGEFFANSGGVDQGGEYDGALHLYVAADLHKVGLWDGLCFYADGFQIHGTSITAANLGSLIPVSGIEATPATRLFEIWLDQSMFNERVSVRVGQLAVDTEFMLSEGASWFLSATYGWPPITAADLPNGGPAYPLSQPAVRVAIEATEQLTLMAAVYNGDPAGPNCTGDPQVCNNHGTDFRFDDPPLLFAEAAYSYELGRLPGTVKLGAWHQSGTFRHQRVDIAGNLIAVTGLPGRPLEDNPGLYGIIDQYLWRKPGSGDPQGVAVFARVMTAKDDRNLVDFYTDMGITFTGMIPGRPNDAFAIGFAYVGISDTVHAYDVDLGLPVAQNYESAIEFCYTMQLRPGWTLQPDFQYIWQPGGNVVDESGRRVENAAVIGARTAFSF